MISLQLGPRAKCGLSKTVRILFHAAAIGAVACSMRPADAAERFWITTLGGAFGSTTNWSATAGGGGGASVPAASDNANFTINSIYTVTFAANTTTAGLLSGVGTTTFDLNANTYTVTGATGTTIGATVNQTGRLTVTDGILAVDTATDRIHVGATGATGFLTISTGGQLGNGTIDPNIIIGNGGTGTLSIDDNGRADLGFLSLGQVANSTGTTTVAGPNAVLDASDVVNVGLAGTGTLTIQNAGRMSSAGATTIGSVLGSNGTANITGAGSYWNQVGGVTIGSSGDAGLTVQAAAKLDTTGSIIIGQSGTGVGTGVVTGADSLWTMANSLQIGSSGLGNFAVSAGGRATTAGSTVVANNAGGRGNVVVTGAGSKWTTKALTIGNAGDATFALNTGAIVESGGNVAIAAAATGTGKATVSGTGTAWNITGDLGIATLGSGTMTVDTSATVSATGALTIGDPAGAPVGTLNFNGGVISVGSFTRAGSSQFNWTDGTMIVNGGTFNNNGAALTINGSDLDDIPVLRIASGGQVTAASVPNITIGGNRQGALIVSGGSSFTTTTASIGGQDTGTGSIHVEGLNSSFTTTGDLGVGGTTVTAGGLGTITLGPKGTLTAGAVLRLWDGGTINISGGTLRFNQLAANGGKVVFNSGAVQVNGNFAANTPALDALLGPTHTLGAGRKIDTLTNSFNLQSDITVAGGTIAGNAFAMNQVVARFESGAKAEFTGSFSIVTGGRVFVTDSAVSANGLSNNGELQLAGSTATVTAPTVNNFGLIAGAGRLNGVITNNAAGQVRVAAGQQMEILGASGTNVNNGLIDVDGGAIEFGRLVTNSSANPSTGLIAARNATLRFNGNLANSGSMTFTAGVSDVFGDITNQNNLATAGRIVVTGGAQANFFDDVVNNGVIQVSATGGLESTAVFLGSFSGNGVAGGGHVFLEGDTRPGFSPGTMAFGGDVSFGPLSTLDIEIGGLAGGTQFDRVTVADTASLDGSLNVSLLNGFKPVIGSSFQILAASGGMSGSFSQLALPALAGGASWNIVYGSHAVTLYVGGVLGDFNLDGVVDTADYTKWRDLLGSNSLAADASGNGTVGPEDLNVWKANFGDFAVSGAPEGGSGAGAQVVGAVPEPATISLVALLALVSAVGTSRRKR